MTLAGIADDYILQLPGEMPGGVVCHVSPGGRGCTTFDVVLPAWHAMRPEHAPAERILLQTNTKGGPPADQATADAGSAHLHIAIGNLRTEATRLINAEMIEVELSSLAPLRSEMPLGGLDVDGSSALMSDEMHRRVLLRGRCPGFFSTLKTSADNYHKKRMSSQPKPGRLTPPRVSEEDVEWATHIQGTPRMRRALQSAAVVE
jgi:hypothetical protein